MRRALTLLVVIAGVSVASDADAIIGGSADTTTSSVVAVSAFDSTGTGGLVCTGTLIAPNVVLTARHCVENGNPACTDMFQRTSRWDKVEIATDAGGFEVAYVRVPKTDAACGDDVALLVLTKPVTNIRASSIRFTAPVKGEAYAAVGYGWVCADTTTSCEGDGKRHRLDGLAVDCLTCREGNFSGTSDSVCNGDSGGPALDASGLVIGVTSVGGDACSTSYYNRVDRHEAFLKDAVREETTMAGVTTPGWVNGVPDPPSDGGVDPAPDSGTNPAPAGDSGGCVVAPRKAGNGWVFAIAVVLITGARWRRSAKTRLVHTTTSSASTTRTTAGRTTRAVTTRSSTISRSSSSNATAPARTSSSAAAAPASSSIG